MLSNNPGNTSALPPKLSLLRRLGISAKLLMAFGATFILAIVIAITGWYGFENIALSQRSVIGNAIPSLKEAQQLAQINAGIVASAGRLAKSSSDADRELVNRYLDNQSSQLSRLADTLQGSDFDSQAVVRLRYVVSEIRDNLVRQNELVRQRLELEDLAGNLAGELLQAAESLTELSESLVANAASGATATSTGLYDLIGLSSNTETTYAALDRLVEVDLDGMERMFELRLRSARIVSYIAQMNREVRPDQIQGLQDRLHTDVTILKRRLADVVDPGRKQQATELLSRIELETRTSNPRSLFNLRVKALEASHSIDNLVSLNNSLARQLTSTTSRLVEDSSRAIDQSTQMAEKSLKTSRTAFLSIAVGTAIAVLVLFWWYLQRSVINRLKTLETTTRAIAGGDLSQPVSLDGNDELTRMANALTVFRENALARKQLESELQDYQQHLERLVQERTGQLEVTNRQLEESVIQHESARQRAEQANRAKTTFLATMSHELRTPVSGMLGTAKLLEQGELEPRQSGYVHALRTAGSSLLNIVNDILDLSKFESGEIRLEFGPFNLEQMAIDLIALMQQPAREKGLELTFSLDPDLRSYMVGDEERLRQVITNLLNNAIKFTDRGSVELQVDLIEERPSNTSRIRFSVQDTGIGIPEQYIDSVFEPFTQVDASTARRQGGIGLGLAISRRLVVAMGGTMSVKSIEHELTEFRVELDLENADIEYLEDTGSRHYQVPDRQLNIMVVEDDPVNAMITRHYLENAGHQVLLASSGNESLTRLENMAQPPDAVLMDIGLPGMDGVQTTHRIRRSIRANLKSMPIIAMSAHIFQEEINEYLHAGMEGYLGKPFSQELLLDTLARAVGRHDTPIGLTEIERDEALIDSSLMERDLASLGRDSMSELVTLFLQTSDENMQQYVSAVDKADHPSAAAVMHRLKSAAGSLGLGRLYAAAAECELLHRQNTNPEIYSPQLGEILAHSRTALEDCWKALDQHYSEVATTSSQNR